MWSVSTPDGRISVATGDEEIIDLDGAVTFRPGELRGERCGNEDFIHVDSLSQRAKQLVTGIQCAAPSARIIVSRRGLITACPDEEAGAALAAIGKLGPSRMPDAISVSRWLSDRMVRCETARPLTNINRTLSFDNNANYVPIDPCQDPGWRKLESNTLTEFGEDLLAAIAQVAIRFGIVTVALARDFFDICLVAPREEARKRLEAQAVVVNLSFAL